MRIVKASKKPQADSRKVNASRKAASRRTVRADEDIEVEDQAVATVDPAATDMLFEAEDVAELVANVTGEEVLVEVDDAEDTVIFTVGEDEYEVKPDGDEEILEASRKSLRGKAPVRASRKAAPARKSLRRR